MVRSRCKSVRDHPRGGSEGAERAEQSSRRRVWGQKPGQPGEFTYQHYGGSKSCTKTRRWYAKTVALSSFSLPVNRNSMPKRDSRMSPPAARLAVKHVKPAALPALRVRCMMPSAQNAESPLRFLSSRERTVLYTAASALPPAADNRMPQRNPEERSLFRVFICLGLPVRYPQRKAFRPPGRGHRPGTSGAWGRSACT